MNSDLNFSISTEGLTEKGKAIADESKIIKEALNDIDAARKSLDGWVSANKDRFESKIAAVLPKMNEMTEVIDSYSGVAVQTSQRAEAVENRIASAIDGDNFNEG